MNRFIDVLIQNLFIEKLITDIDITDEEFNKVIRKLNTLRIDCNTPIYFFDDLKNIRTINISNVINSNKEENIDYNAINQFVNLETLIISHNINLRSLNLSNLKKIKNLIIVGNENLEVLKGLNNINSLNNAIIVGNGIRHIDKFKEFLDNNLDCHMLKLDINLYHDLMKQHIEIDKYKLGFAEKISVGELYHLDTKMMANLYFKGIQVLSGIINNTMSDEEKIEKIYKFIIQKLRYDFEDLEKRNNYVYTHNIGIYDNDYKDINSSYKALIEYKAVCEGYANLFKFLLNIEGIESETIVCFYKNSNEKFEYLNHTANKIWLNNEWLYCDPQLEDNINNLRFFLKTRDEFSNTHILIDDKLKNR